MLKRPSLWRKVGKGLWRGFSSLHRWTKVFLTAAGAFGISLTATSKAARFWLLAEWTHSAAAILALAFLCALLYFFGIEKDLAQAKIVSVSIIKASCVLQSVVNYTFPARVVENEVCIVIDLLVLNRGENQAKIFFPSVELAKKTGGKWKVLDITMTEPLYGRISSSDKHNALGGLWRPNDKFSVPGSDQVVASVVITGTVGDGPTIIHAETRAGLVFNVLAGAQTAVSLLVSLPRIDNADHESVAVSPPVVEC